MKIFRNPDVKILLRLLAVPYVLCVGALCFINIISALIAATVLLLFIISFLLVLKQRNREIERLTDNISDILNGETNINISQHREGEIAILESKIQKMFMRLKEQNEALAQNSRFLSDSIADISHQLKTPLTSINLIVSLLQSSELSDERRLELTRELSMLLARSDSLITTLLKLSRIDAGTVSFESKETSLSDIVKAAAEPLSVMMDIKNQRFICNASDTFFKTDAAWTTEALGNIIKNCAEHTPQGGFVRVDATDNPIYTEIIISDSGNGFDENDLPHIFERFYKGKNCAKESFGIGLALSSMIITSQNGTIKAENGEDGGARFVIKFYKDSTV